MDLVKMEIDINKKTEIGLKLNELKKQQLELEKEGYENGKWDKVFWWKKNRISKKR